MIPEPSPSSKPAKGTFERYRDDWQKQMLRDRAIPSVGFLKVGMALSLHFNRKQFNSGDGLIAFPGIERTLAPLTGLSTRTVMRAIKWFEQRGHVRIERRRSGKKNLVNLYHPLRRTIAQLNKVPKAPRRAARVSVPSDTRCQGVVTLGVTLLSDLHSDLPVTLYKNIATPGGVDTQIGSHQGSEGKEEGDIREENGFFTVSDSPSNTEPVDSVKAECYRFARQLFNKRGASIVARAIADGKTPEEVMESLVDFAESGGDVDDFAASLFPTAWR